MPTRTLITFLLTLALFFPSACRKKQSQRTAKESAPSSKKQSTTSGQQGLEKPILTPFEKAQGRYLEYYVNLDYRCQDLNQTRQELLGIIQKYGFIKNSQANVSRHTARMSTEVHIKTDDIYRALQDLDQLGVLLREQIRVKDHNGEVKWSERRIKRASLREKRREKSLSKTDSKTKNWPSVEGKLAQSEDMQDKMAQKKWELKDKVKWAKVTLNLKGPEPPSYIKIPNYRNALVAAVNGFLKFIEVLLRFLPAIVIVLLFFYVLKRNTSGSLISLGEKSDSQKNGEKEKDGDRHKAEEVEGEEGKD